jgi:PAS domain S-box-containing protein
VSIFQQLQQALESGDAFAAVADAMPQLVWTSSADGTVDYFNRRWIDYTGVTLEASRDLGPLAGIVHPDESDATWLRWTTSIADCVPFEIEHRLCGIDGSYRWFLTRAEPLLNADGKVIRWVGTATDVDEQRRLRDSLTYIVETGNIFLSSLDEPSICRALADVTIAQFADWCFVSIATPSGIATPAIAHRNADLLRYVEAFSLRHPVGAGDAVSRVIATNTPVVVERLTFEHAFDPDAHPDRFELLRRLHLRSVMVVPITTQTGNVLGAVSVASAESGREFRSSDLHVLSAVADRAAAAIENVRLLAGERRTSQRLRFVSRINEVLLDSSNAWTAMASVASAIAADLADACVIVKLEGDAVRVEAVAARDPQRNEVVAALAGQRPLRPEYERRLAHQLRNHESVVHETDSVDRMKAQTWPYLGAQIEALDAHATVVVPLHLATAVYGALTVVYSSDAYEPLRDLPTIEDVAARASVAVERAETLERERNIASTLQKASLPSIIPQPEGLHFDHVYLPAAQQAEVGGDWYDAIELDDGSVVISVGDVTGRGVQAAVIMSKVRHAMGMVPLHETDPARILDSAEWFLRKRYPDAIVTAFVAVIDPNRTSMRFANAGHLPPLVRRGDELLELEKSGLPLGLRHLRPNAASHSVELRDSDLLVLYTDGLVEWNRDWEAGARALTGVMSSGAIVATTSPAKLIARTCLPERPHDDVAILSVRIRHEPAWSFLADDARAAADARTNFATFLRRRGFGGAETAQAELVFGELLGNVVRHAPGPVEIQLYCEDGRRTLHVIDSGKGFEETGTLPDDMLSELGRGLFIVQQIAKRVDVEHVPNCGNHITVTL